MPDAPIRPEPAPVRPRAAGPGGEVLLLEDLVEPWIARARRGVVQVLGPPGWGKTTALAHLSHVFRDRPGLAWLDEAVGEEVALRAHQALVLHVSSRPVGKALDRYHLAPWGPDEWLEFLQARHPAACGTVLPRLTPFRADDPLSGIPELWREVLDEMAEDPAIESPRDALARRLGDLLSEGELGGAGRWCLTILAGKSPSADATALQPLARMLHRRERSKAFRLLRHRPVMLWLGTARLLADLLQERFDPGLWRPALPREIRRQLARQIPAGSTAFVQLERIAAEQALRDHNCANAASVLHAIEYSGWRPAAGCRLVGADLEDANWPGIALDGADLTGAVLARAYLRRATFQTARLCLANLADACLAGTRMASADLHGANLARADLTQAVAPGCILTGASLQGACLAGANLKDARLENAQVGEADFSGAVLRGARLTGVDLSTATLDGASFEEAHLENCNLEGVTLPEARFPRAFLDSALLTGSRMRGGDFRSASLVRARLAEIDWEGADLRGADLTGATFHLGTTRSGLVFSPLASEGTRTGFYTDEWDDRSYKAPEELRKASLRGADLRGARVLGTDFYLVDLRGARCDPGQRDHFARCGAILDRRPPPAEA